MNTKVQSKVSSYEFFQEMEQDYHSLLRFGLIKILLFVYIFFEILIIYVCFALKIAFINECHNNLFFKFLIIVFCGPEKGRFFNSLIHVFGETPPCAIVIPDHNLFNSLSLRMANCK